MNNSSMASAARIDHVRFAGNGEKHVEHVGAMTQVIARINKRLIQGMFVGSRSDGRQFRDDAMRHIIRAMITANKTSSMSHGIP
jgi:hypothetical protein